MASFEKRGKNYRAVVSVMKDGTRQKVSQTFPTKKAATDWATLMESDKIQGKNITASNMLFSDYFEFWFKTYKEKEIRESTSKTYSSTLNNIKLLFSRIKLSELTSYKLQSMVDEYGKTHYKSTVNMFTAHLKACLKDAHYDDYIVKDVYSRLKPHGKISNKPINTISATNFEKLQQFLYSKNKLCGSEMAILICLETGARIGEVIALTMNDISVPFNNVHIDKSFSSAINEVTEPKNKNSYRDIKVTSRLIAVIKKYGQNKDNSKSICGISHNAVKQMLDKILKKLEINRITIHGLRRSHASYLLYKGISINYVSARLGHANISITQRVYAHMLKEEEVNETEKTLELLSDKSKLKIMSPNVPIGQLNR